MVNFTENEAQILYLTMNDKLDGLLALPDQIDPRMEAQLDYSIANYQTIVSKLEELCEHVRN